MRLAFLGASSQIARDLAPLFAQNSQVKLSRFVRDIGADHEWRAKYQPEGVPAARPLVDFGAQEDFDAIVNFIGVGDPARAAMLGARILDITYQYDEIVLDYLRRRPSCRYLFLSSGAAYGTVFERPATQSTQARFPINGLGSHCWYGLAKFLAECRHRASPELAVADIRIFSYVSRSLNVNSRYLIADIVRALAHGQVLKTSSQDIIRDYVSPQDLFSLMWIMLTTCLDNVAVDVYSKATVRKMMLLAHLGEQFGLRHALVDSPVGINVSGIKPNYFSKNRKAAEFGYDPQCDSLTAVTDAIRYILSQP